MNIGWYFLDKRKATIDAIKAYTSMEYIIRNTDEDIRNHQEKMESFGGPKIDDMPHVRNPQATEDRIISCIDEIDTLRERFRQANEYMNWFEPAWEQLSEDEKYILGTAYMGEEEGSISQIEDYFGVSRSGAYNRKNRALNHLVMLLYGKV